MRVHRYTVAGEPVTVYYPTTQDEASEFLAWVRQGHRFLALDTETTGLDTYSLMFGLRLVQVGDRSTAWVMQADMFREAIREALRTDTRWVLHNAAFDLQVLERAGLIERGFMARVFDTKILAHLLDPRSQMEGGIGLGLKPLSAVFVDADAPDTQAGLHAVFREIGMTKATGWRGIPIDHPTYVLYAGLDVILTSRLFEVLGPRVRERGFSRLAQFEHEVAAVCLDMMRRGIRLDVPYTERLVDDLAAKSEEGRQAARRYGVDNVESTAQVAAALAGMGAELAERTPSGKPKVDKAVLAKLAAGGNALAQSILDAKRAAKWRESYAVAMLDLRDADDRIHPDVSALQARTARMSISRPPLQQLPSKDWLIRRALLADPGHLLLSVDYQAVEMRVLAALADVKAMKRAITEGEDLHGFTAGLIYGADYTKAQRGICKGVGFGKVYGGGAETLARQTGAPINAVREAIAAYDRIYPEIKRYGRRLQREAQFGALEVVTPTGRHLPLDRQRLYSATNYVVQSTARDILAQALLDLDEAGLGEHLLLPIHDEVLAQAPAREAADVAREIGRVMSGSLYGVPIDTDPEVLGPSWGSGYGCPPELDAPVAA